MTCANCGLPVAEHECEHLVPCCPGRCSDWEVFVAGDGQRSIRRRRAEGDPPRDWRGIGASEPDSLGWHVIEGSRLLDLLRSVAAGEDPDLAFAALWANADHEETR